MKTVFSVMLVFLLSFVAVAQWIMLPLERTVKDSDLIVIGTLRNVLEETRDGFDNGKGDILVDEVLWGDAKTGQKLSLVWGNASDVSCPRVEHRDDQNKQLIWLLTLTPTGKVVANNPSRVVTIKNKEKVLELLRDRKKANKPLQTTS